MRSSSTRSSEPRAPTPPSRRSSDLSHDKVKQLVVGSGCARLLTSESPLVARGTGCLLPAGFGREVDRYCVLELERNLEPGAELTRPPSWPSAVSAIRLATAAAGPFFCVVRAAGLAAVQNSTVLPIAATQPPGEATRLDSFRAAELTRELLSAPFPRRRGRAARRGARHRWELSLFQNEPFPVRAAARRTRGLLGDTWELRAAVLLGDASEERRAIHASLRALRLGRAGLGARRGVQAFARRNAAARRQAGARPLARRTSCSDCARRGGWLTPRRTNRHRFVTNA